MVPVLVFLDGAKSSVMQVAWKMPGPVFHDWPATMKAMEPVALSKSVRAPRNIHNLEENSILKGAKNPFESAILPDLFRQCGSQEKAGDFTPKVSRLSFFPICPSSHRDCRSDPLNSLRARWPWP